MSNTNTGKQGGAPSMPNDFSAKCPNKSNAPRMGGSSFGSSPNKSERGKDGTSK